MIKTFDEFNSKFKFLFGFKTDKEVTEALNMKPTTFTSMSRRDAIPFEQVINYCKERNVDLNWILNLKKKK